jgi:hypothetical protein
LELDVDISVHDRDGVDYLILETNGARIECAWTDIDKINYMFTHFYQLLRGAQDMVNKEAEVLEFVKALEDL